MDWMEYLHGFLEYGVLPVLFFSLIMCGLGMPVPEEVLFVFAGYWGRRFSIDPLLLCATGISGILVGDIIPYSLGRHLGAAILQKPYAWCVFLLRYRRRAEDFFRQHGSKTVFFARFIPGLRTPVFLIAGIMHTSLANFLLWDGMGAMITCPITITLAYCFGEKVRYWFLNSQGVVLSVGLALSLLVALLVYSQRKWEKKGD
jgi:membrane protein DedA with SNARE-associated domain